MIFRRLRSLEKRPTRDDEANLSRRSLLAGMGLAGLFAFAGPTILATGDAEAQQGGPPRGRGPGPGPGRRRGPPRSPGSRGRGRRRRGGQRYSRRDLVRRCRGDRSFYRRNRDLCAQATRMGRRRAGTCIQIGPVQICE